MKKYVLFDFADTIAELVPSREKIINDFIFSNSRIKIDEELISKAYLQVSTSMPYSSVITRTNEQRLAYYEEFNRAMFINLGILHKVDPKDLINNFKKTKAHWILKEGVTDLFLKLKNLEYKIGILSNFDTRLSEIIKNNLRINNYIDFMHISQSEYLEKPNILFYESFFSKNAIKIEESIYIGDSYFLDYLPANKLNLTCFLLDEKNNYPFVNNRIQSLDEIMIHL